MKTNSKPQLEIISFETAETFRTWLHNNHAISPGIRIRMFKKASGKPSLTRTEAILEALCYGWIDAIANKYDDESWLQTFVPRRPRSIWSKINRDYVAQLINEGKMQPAGMVQVEAAKADGRWDAAYDSPRTMTVPEDFLNELSKDPKAEAFFKTLNKSNLYAIGWRLQTAKKPETRERRMKALLEMLSKGEKLH